MNPKLSIKILLYHFFFKAFVNYITANATRLQATAFTTPLATMATAWNLTFDLYVNPATRNMAVNSDMNGLFNTNSLYTEGLKNVLRGNPLVPLTGADRLSLDIPAKNPRRGHIPVPTVQPNGTIVSKSPLQVKIFVFDPANPTTKKKGKDIDSIGYLMAIVAAGGAVPPVDSPLFVNQIPEKNSIFEKYFTLEQVGSTAYFQAYYLNARNEAGLPGEMFSSVIV